VALLYCASLGAVGNRRHYAGVFETSVGRDRVNALEKGVSPRVGHLYSRGASMRGMRFDLYDRHLGRIIYWLGCDFIWHGTGSEGDESGIACANVGGVSAVVADVISAARGVFFLWK